jgi:ribA/ribD-fused uncharacterized protein
MAISFTKVALPHGWLGNMAPSPVQYDGKRWKTTEALFQALRFRDDAVKEAIRDQRSPMSVKMLARRHLKRGANVVVPRSEQDLANMEMVLRLKLEQHQELRQKLLDIGDETIIEDCTNRPGGSGKFWGATFKDGQWVGENWLGKLWMKLRQELRESRSQSSSATPHRATATCVRWPSQGAVTRTLDVCALRS